MPRGRPAKRISANKNIKETEYAYREESHSNDNESPDRSITRSRSPNTSRTSVSSTDTSYSKLSPLPSPSSYGGTSFTGSTGSSTSSPKASPFCSRKIYPDLSDSTSEENDPSGIYPKLDDTSERSSRHKSTSSESVRSRPSLGRSTMYEIRSFQTDHDNEKNLRKQSYNKDKASNISLKYICIGLAIILLSACFVNLYNKLFNLPSTGAKDEKEEINKYDFFTREIQKLQPNFPNQNKRLWKTVIASSRHVLKEPNSTYPSVIMLASQAETPDLSFCIAERIASSFLQSYDIFSNVPSMDVESLKELDASEQKLSLDRAVQSALHSSHGKAFVIRNLQSLSPQAALLLHGLCDGDNAPFKDVMILMTLEVKKSIPPKTADEIEDHLTQLWSTPQVEYDKVSAVMSRISNNLVIVTSEDSNVVDQVCPHHQTYL